MMHISKRKRLMNQSNAEALQTTEHRSKRRRVVADPGLHEKQKERDKKILLVSKDSNESTPNCLATGSKTEASDHNNDDHGIRKKELKTVNHQYEIQLAQNAGVEWDFVIGVDEVGRGCLAGPLVVCACHIPHHVMPTLSGINDSKTISEPMREQIYSTLDLHSEITYATEEASPDEIDRSDILTCVMSAMTSAVRQLITKLISAKQISKHSHQESKEMIKGFHVTAGDSSCCNEEALDLSNIDLKDVHSEDPTTVQPKDPTAVHPDNPTPTQLEDPTVIQSDDPTAVQPENPTRVQPENPTHVQPEDPSHVQPEDPADDDTLRPVWRCLIWIDGNRMPEELGTWNTQMNGQLNGYNVMLRSRCIVGGDASIFSIAAASIIAKVTRDRILNRLDLDFPVYGFVNHKGYGTERHKEAILAHGALDWHRLSYRPICEWILSGQLLWPLNRGKIEIDPEVRKEKMKRLRQDRTQNLKLEKTRRPKHEGGKHGVEAGHKGQANMKQEEKQTRRKQSDLESWIKK